MSWCCQGAVGAAQQGMSCADWPSGRFAYTLGKGRDQEIMLPPPADKGSLATSAPQPPTVGPKPSNCPPAAPTRHRHGSPQSMVEIPLAVRSSSCYTPLDSLLWQVLPKQEFQWLNKFHQMDMLLFTLTASSFHFPPAMDEGTNSPHLPQHLLSVFI